MCANCHTVSLLWRNDYVGAQREIFIVFFFSSILCNSKLCVTDEFSKGESISSHNVAELSPAKE